MTRPSMLEAALDYARQGFRVHPLRPGTKVPMLPAWQTAATTDPESIATWWGLHPTANVGIATGEASDLWVLDIDTGHGPDAAVSLAALEAAHGPLAQTTEVVTPSGGRHLWYAWPRDTAGGTWRNTNALGRGIDVRAEGGQVAVWPSVLADGTRYRKPKGRRTTVPPWLAEMAKHRDAGGDGVRVALADLTPAGADAASQYGQRALDAACAELKALGEQAVADWGAQRAQYRGPSWDDATFLAACRLLRLAQADWATGVSPSDVPGLLTRYAPTDSGFTGIDHARILDSARQAVGADTATLPAHLLKPLPLLEVPGETGPPKVDPAAFFDKTGLRAQALADVTDEGDLAIAADGRLHRYSEGAYRLDPEVIERRLVQLLGNRFRPAHAATVERVVRLGRPLPALGDDDEHADHLNVRNGMLDWRTGVLVPHSPAFRSRMQYPITFDPAATCPRFDAWLAEVAGPELTPLLLEVVGYCLLIGNPLQRALLLVGSGGNGKGTLMRVIRSMVGGQHVAAVPLHELGESRFAVADLYGAAVNLAGDIEARELKSTAMLKQVTGGDSIRGERKYGQAFTFTCHATPVFSANELFRSSDASAGFLRRWVLVPMSRPVGAAGRFDEHALYAEASGILNRALPALRALLQRGDFTRTAAGDALATVFAEQADLVRTWLAEDDAVLDADPGRTDGAWRPRLEVFARFRTWALDSGHKPMSSTRFYARLEALGYCASRRKSVRGLYGIALDSLPGGMRPLGVSLLP